MLTECLNNPCVSWTIRIIRWLPVIFILAVICWSYYAYVYELCIRTVPGIGEKGFYLTVYHLLLCVFLWAYWQTTFAEVGGVPHQFNIPAATFAELETASSTRQRLLLENVANDLPVQTRTFDGSIRYCEKCRAIKPDRAHHCSVCGLCVLKMDHHCPWVNTCVNFWNYKFFVLFLAYALVYCLFIATTDLQYFIKFWTDSFSDAGAGKFHVMFLFFVSIMFSVSVSSLLFYHLWLTAKNRSTLESFRSPVFEAGPDKDGFSLGIKANYQEVFGDRLLLWFFPIFTGRGDGVLFPSNQQLSQRYAASACPPVVLSIEALNAPSTYDNRQSQTGSGDVVLNLSHQPNKVCTAKNGHVPTSPDLLGDGVTFPVRTFDVESYGLLSQQRWHDDDLAHSGSDYDNSVELERNGLQMTPVVIK